jgi:hypothetical protein
MCGKTSSEIETKSSTHPRCVCAHVARAKRPCASSKHTLTTLCTLSATCNCVYEPIPFIFYIALGLLRGSCI